MGDLGNVYTCLHIILIYDNSPITNIDKYNLHIMSYYN